MISEEKRKSQKKSLNERFNNHVARFFLILFLALPIALIVFPRLITLLVVLLCDLLYLLYALIAYKRDFRLHVTNPPWQFWLGLLFLTLATGGGIYMFVSGETLETLMKVSRYSGGLGLFPGIWILALFFLFSFEEIKSSEEKQREIDEVYKKSFGEDPVQLAYLTRLANIFREKDFQGFFPKHPAQAAKVFEGTQRLIKLMEEGKKKDTDLSYYYYQLGRMYETGFAAPPDPAKAKEYYTKAQKQLDNLQKPN